MFLLLGGYQSKLYKQDEKPSRQNEECTAVVACAAGGAVFGVISFLTIMRVILRSGCLRSVDQPHPQQASKPVPYSQRRPETKEYYDLNLHRFQAPCYVRNIKPQYDYITNR